MIDQTETLIEMIVTEAIQIPEVLVIGKIMKMAVPHKRIEIIEISMVQKIEIGKSAVFSANDYCTLSFQIIFINPPKNGTVSNSRL